MDLLILGGTAMLGRQVAAQAVAAGHRVTCLARGGRPAPDGVTFVAADRDAADAYESLHDHRWDAVVDVSSQPGRVRRAVRELSAEHWVYVSSASAYAPFQVLEPDESFPVLAPLDADTFTDPHDFGAAKVACEHAIRDAGTTATIIRPALIGGDGDWSARSGYYGWRFANPTGPDVLVPPDLTLPTAVIDAADLAAWIVEVAERRLDGVFNAAGVTVELGEFIEASRAVAGPQAPPARPVPVDVLRTQGVNEWMGPKSLPLWVDDPDDRFGATLNTSAARANGLRTRPLPDTLAAALAYEQSRVEPRMAGLTDAEEIELREALDADGR